MFSEIKKFGRKMKKVVQDSLASSDEEDKKKNHHEAYEMKNILSQPKMKRTDHNKQHINKNIKEDEQQQEDLLDFYPLDHITQFDTSKLPQRVRDKVDNFKCILSRNVINPIKLRDQCFNGIPEDCGGLRSIVWKLVLEHLPLQKEKWQQAMDQSRETYNMLAKKYIYDIQTPSPEVWEQQEKDENDYYLYKTKELSVQNPEWANFFKDRDLWIEIEKDTTRTRSEMHFFVTETLAHNKFYNPYKRPENQTEEMHFDVLSRILFVYAKINPGIRYVQGMNEILAIFYHVFLSDRAFAAYVEEDCFFCFTIIMAEVRDCFIKVMDDSDSGIKARIESLNLLLKQVDPSLWQSLEDMKLNPHFYSLRWLMLIFTQEFEIFDVMRLWDSYISHPHRQEFMDYICIAILQIQKEHLIEDFAEAMENLQRIQHLDVVQIVFEADKLYKQFCPHAQTRIISF